MATSNYQIVFSDFFEADFSCPGSPQRRNLAFLDGIQIIKWKSDWIYVSTLQRSFSADQEWLATRPWRLLDDS